MKKYFALAALASACTVPIKPPPVPSVPLALVRTVATTVWTEDGRPVAGASCSIDQAPPPRGASNAEGYVAWDGMPASRRDLQLTCGAEGFNAFSEHRALATDGNEELGPVTLVATNVDPMRFSLGQLAAFKGAMWPRTSICADSLILPFGPRPGQPDNIIATAYLDNYTSIQQEAIAKCLTDAGLTHVVVGGFVDWWAYHGQYIGHDYSTDEGFERLLDQLQWWYNHKLIPVVFVHRDGASFEETETMMRRLVAGHPRAMKLIRIVVMSGWEPAKYEWSSCTWAKYVALGKELFPRALNTIHTTTDIDAAVGADALCNDDDHNWNPEGNGGGWKRVIEAGLHAWLIQNGAYPAGPDAPGWADKAREFAAQFKRDGDGALYHGVAWHFGGPGGWIGDSAFGKGIPICLEAAEHTSYEAYWYNRPSDAARNAWGNLAVASGACGALDGVSVAVPVRR